MQPEIKRVLLSFRWIRAADHGSISRAGAEGFDRVLVCGKSGPKRGDKSGTVVEHIVQPTERERWPLIEPPMVFPSVEFSPRAKGDPKGIAVYNA